MLGNDTNTDPFQENTRPKGITVLSMLLIIFSLFQIIRIFLVITRWNLLSSLNMTFSPLLQGGEGFLWALCGLILAWGLWKGKRWSPLSLVIACLIFAIFSWIKLVFISEPIVLQTRWPVNLLVTILGLGSLFGFLNLKSTQSYLGKITVKIP
jgi:hypothetical protein